MRLNYKCLTETTAIALVSLLLIDLSDCKPPFGIDNVLDPPSTDDALIIESDRLTPEKEAENEARADLDELEKRAWNSNFAAWGKKKRWGNFATWGKRNSENNYAADSADGLHPIEKRGWFKFNSWGKRSDDDNDIDNNKRKWSSFASWGKRNGDNMDMFPEKRKWKSFAAWGKRSNDVEKDLDSVQGLNTFEPDKRKWSNFASWGKRDLELVNPEKRKWSSFASWGKREDMEDTPEKRRWSQFSAWGKRRPYPYDWTKRRWAQFNSWGKRRWAGLATWGKRAVPFQPENRLADSIASKLLQFFDRNGDDMLDRDELRSYIQTLMSLPSSVEVEST